MTNDPCPECGAVTNVICDDPVLLEQGPYEVVCMDCHWTMYVPGEATARSRIGKLRQIVNEHRAYEALSPGAREKFGKPELGRLVDFGWKHVR